MRTMAFINAGIVAIALSGFLVPTAINSAPSAHKALPKGFVYLRDVEPTIRQDIRYAGSHNFVGRPISGYDAAECVLTEKAALALAAVQATLAKQGLSLNVWDCYRPARAVKEFVRWTKDASDTKMKAEFYPNFDKTQSISVGYLSSRSAHSRGSTVDLGIVPTNITILPQLASNEPLKPCSAPKGQRFEDGTIDLGTGYDCFDEQARFDHSSISDAARANRTLLRDLMIANGFRPLQREWWHFELIDEPFPQEMMDFPIPPHPRTKKD